MVSVVKQDGRQNDGCELMDIQHRIQPVILSPRFFIVVPDTTWEQKV
jgi:hypothetical protein